ncbi:hypothetical protein [Gloeocapsa sp. PCC 73106]|uniref:hypothetical protein n=1 Tax=Gloeocapsa sp. PCC 73106 TaxID=102232 RepID=UPI0002ABE230|nr:hypothetical protein [Gloeocapsa sp. PCC 73106]ELR96775.1 hypothetical protein GLO73106DRAFT_00005740 [Gloeocapsa sp. PCC 73106]
MNIRVVIFSGIMTALVGAMIGAAVGHIGNRRERTPGIIGGGVVLGFVIGSAQEAVRQQNRQRIDEEEEN